jgi:phage terminase small subunit
MALTAKQKLFVQEYLIDLNATRSYKTAGYVAKGNAAEVNASRLLSNAKVQAAIQEAMGKREKRTEITQDKVLERWWAIATADPNELVHLRRLCCRYCFGSNHEFQWLDVREYEASVEMELQAAELEDREPQFPSDAGGYGFDRSFRPHPKCPKCKGEGIPELHIADTKEVSDQARMLYAGAKHTQAGIEIKTHDQLKALEIVTKHLGMLRDKLELTGDEGGPLQVVFSSKIRKGE